MPTFTTPGPIAVSLTANSGRVSLFAGDRADTVIRVRPTDETAAGDAKAAEQTRVDYTAGRLEVRAPDPNWFSGLLGAPPSVDIAIELPTGSTLRAETNKAEIHAEGHLDEVHCESVSGAVHLDRVGALTVETVSGTVTANDVVRHATVNGVSGDLRVRRTSGSAIVKVVGGAIRIDDGVGDLHLSTVGGDITVTSVGAGLTAKSASGNIRVGRVTTGEVELLTGSGEVELGVGEGVSAWVDARSRNGSVRNSLQSLESPAEHGQVVKVRIRTRQGDVMIHRSADADTATEG